jgi:hypothetical protein
LGGLATPQSTTWGWDLGPVDMTYIMMAHIGFESEAAIININGETNLLCNGQQRRILSYLESD